MVLLERGPFPGSKNMYGGVVYPRILDELIPNWWEDAPIQRWVTRRSTMVLTETQALTVDYRTGVSTTSGSVAATGTIGGFEDVELREVGMHHAAWQAAVS